MRKERWPRGGFAIVEFPAVLLCLGLVTLGLSLLLWKITGHVPWFVCVVGGLFTALAVALLVMLLGPPMGRGRRKD